MLTSLHLEIIHVDVDVVGPHAERAPGEGRVGEGRLEDAVDEEGERRAPDAQLEGIEATALERVRPVVGTDEAPLAEDRVVATDLLLDRDRAILPQAGAVEVVFGAIAAEEGDALVGFGRGLPSFDTEPRLDR